ncbi:hypothetical protein BDR26DRAFT_12008 [Obelidium mucronatum]|nr:hypothetical protein BDR26DRAFT_12008 [Obelidium mucronatum]
MKVHLYLSSPEYTRTRSDSSESSRIGLLLSLLTGNTSNQCISKVIIEFTNRFDYALSQRSDIKKFYRMFRDLARLTELSPNSIVWVANNNFERAYMEYRLGIRLPFIRVLRPLGVIGEDSQYSYPSDLPKPNDSTLIALNHSGSNVFRLLQKTNVPLLVIPNEHTNYGGPNALRQFKGFIEFPYQVSTMKFYENLASGVTMLIPTPQFLERIWLNRDHEVFYFMNVLRDLTPSFANLYRRSAPLYPHVRGFPDWSGYMDYYAAEFAPYILYFDSFQELKDFAVMKNIRTNEITEKQKEFYKQTQKSTIAEWKSIFRTMEYI